MAHIYKITSPSKKIYVGSSVNIKERFRSYKRLKCKTQTRLYNSFIKYGVDNHKFEIITECSIDELLSLECYYGNLYNTLSKNGLNCVLPNKDDKFICRSLETRNKLSQSNKGKFVSYETREKLRIANIGKQSPLKGKKIHTIESKLKLKNSHTGKKLSLSHKQNISNALKGKYPKNHNSLHKLKQKVLLNINYGIFHESITEAAKFYNVSISLISCMLNNKRKNKYNLIFA